MVDTGGPRGREIAATRGGPRTGGGLSIGRKIARSPEKRPKSPDVDKTNAIARIASDAVWEPIFGYSRAVRAGDWIAVSGTTSFDQSGKIVGYGQMYVQARQAIANVAAALDRAGSTLADVVRTRMFTTDMRRFEEIARAHRESFGASPPAATLVEVRRLVHPDLLFEIEADAFAPLSSAARLPPGASKRVRDLRQGSEVNAVATKARPKKPNTRRAR